MLKLSKEAAQIVFNEIAKARGPADTVSAIIQMCLKAGAVVPGAEATPEPEPEPTPEPEEVIETKDNASGEGDVASYGD